jgi:hypothetical protein
VKISSKLLEGFLTAEPSLGHQVADRYDVFLSKLSYSRNDFQAGAKLRLQLAGHGFSVFKDDESIREGEL